METLSVCVTTGLFCLVSSAGWLLSETEMVRLRSAIPSHLSLSLRHRKLGSSQLKLCHTPGSTATQLDVGTSPAFLNIRAHQALLLFKWKTRPKTKKTAYACNWLQSFTFKSSSSLNSKFDANSCLQWNEIIFNIQLDGGAKKGGSNNCKIFSGISAGLTVGLTGDN